MSKDSEQLGHIQRRLAVAILWVVLAYVIFWLGWYFADILRILACAILLSYMLINAVDFIEKYLRNRALAVGLVYLSLVGFSIVGAVILIPAVVYQISQLITTTIDKLPEALNALARAMGPIDEHFRAYKMDIKVMDVIGGMVADLPKPDPGAVLARVTEMTMSTMTWVFYWVSISIITFYFLLEGYKMKEWVLSLAPREHREALSVIASDIDRSLQSFFKGQIVLGLAFGVVMLAVYAGLQVQCALLLSLFLALCEVLPVIGPPIGFFPAVIVVGMDGSILPGNRLIQVILLTTIFSVLQWIKDNIVGPRYIGNVIGVHPVLIFIAIMVGARLDGMLGIIVALPAACVLNVVISHLPLAATVARGVVAEPSGQVGGRVEDARDESIHDG
jgi:predicted PurR-regulated permease PerM